MNVERFGSLDPEANFLNLSLLVCHLFVGGKFEIINILYHSSAFDDRFLVSMDSFCPFEIPKTTHDISTNETIPIDRRNQRTDKILQLIFLSPDHLIEQFNGIQNLLTFYRIFVFTTSVQLDLSEITSTIRPSHSSSALLLILNTLSNVLSEFILSRSSIKSVDLNLKLNRNGQLDANELFDSVFGDSASGRFLVASMVHEYLCEPKQAEAYNLTRRMVRAFASLFYTRIKLSFVDGGIFNCSTLSIKHQRLRPIKRSFYSDYSFEYEPDPNAEKIPFESTIRIYRDTFPRSIEPKLWNKSVQAIQPFSDYMQFRMDVIFIYGADFRRPVKSFIASAFWESLSFWILFVAFLVGAYILLLLKQKSDQTGESFSHCLFEMYCTVIGNGSVRIQTGTEKLFFSAALITAFLFVSIYLADYSMHSLLDNRLRVDSFKELAKRDVPIHLNGFFAGKMDYVTNLLRKKLKKKPNITTTATDEAKEDKAKAIIVPSVNTDYNMRMLTKQKKDYDLITEPLGVVYANFYVVSDGYIPDQTTEKFETAIMSFNENGLSVYWFNSAVFWLSIWAGAESRSDKHRKNFDVAAIGLNEFFYPVLIYVCVLLCITIVFGIEIFWPRIHPASVVPLPVFHAESGRLATKPTSWRL